MSNLTSTPVENPAQQADLCLVLPPPAGGEPQPPPGLISRIGAAVARRVRRVWRRIDWRLVRWGAHNRWIATLYYSLFNRNFDREHQIMLAGRVAFEKAKKESASTSSLLRRNTHRLEKGLLMRPRRPVFALDYIRETMAFYTKEVTSRPTNRISTPEELKWAHDVLKNYFAVTGDHPRINALREKFQQLPHPAEIAGLNGQSWVPYQRDLTQAPSVVYEDLLALAWRRRSVRWFLPKPVPRDLIEKAAAVASLSPSACNRQPFLFRVFDDPELVSKVAALPGGTVGFYHQFPAIVVVVGEMRNYYGERDRHLIYIDGSLAAMSFVYAAETLGLGTCCINWPDIEVYEKAADRMLKLEKDQRPIMFLAVGYPDPEGMVAYSQKKPISQICKYNFE